MDTLFRRLSVVVVAVFAAAFLSPALWADVIILKNGKIHLGRLAGYEKGRNRFVTSNGELVVQDTDIADIYPDNQLDERILQIVHEILSDEVVFVPMERKNTSLPESENAKAQTLFEDGKKLHLRGRAIEALLKYKEATLEDPAFAGAKIGMAEIFAEAQKPSRALGLVDWALEKYPGNEYLKKFKRDLEKDKDAPTGELDLDKIKLTYSGEDHRAELHYYLSRYHVQAKDMDKAREHWAEYLKLDPAMRNPCNAGVHKLRGIDTMLNDARYDRAIEELESFSSLFPLLKDEAQDLQDKAFNAKVDSLIARGRMDAAAEEVKFLLERYPGKNWKSRLFDIWHRQFEGFLKSESYMEAIVTFRNIQMEFPGMTDKLPAKALDLHRMAAEKMEVLGQCLEAARVYESLLELRPDLETDIKSKIAEYYGKHAASLNDINAAIRYYRLSMASRADLGTQVARNLRKQFGNKALEFYEKGNLLETLRIYSGIFDFDPADDSLADSIRAITDEYIHQQAKNNLINQDKAWKLLLGEISLKTFHELVEGRRVNVQRELIAEVESYFPMTKGSWWKYVGGTPKDSFTVEVRVLDRKVEGQVVTALCEIVRYQKGVAVKNNYKIIRDLGRIRQKEEDGGKEVEDVLAVAPLKEKEEWTFKKNGLKFRKSYEKIKDVKEINNFRIDDMICVSTILERDDKDVSFGQEYYQKGIGLVMKSFPDEAEKDWMLSSYFIAKE